MVKSNSKKSAEMQKRPTLVTRLKSVMKRKASSSSSLEKDLGKNSKTESSKNISSKRQKPGFRFTQAKSAFATYVKESDVSTGHSGSSIEDCNSAVTDGMSKPIAVDKSASGNKLNKSNGNSDINKTHKDVFSEAVPKAIHDEINFESVQTAFVNKGSSETIKAEELAKNKLKKKQDVESKTDGTDREMYEEMNESVAPTNEPADTGTDTNITTTEMEDDYEGTPFETDPQFQEECKKYEEQFLNLKNVLKGRKSDVLPEVVVVSTSTDGSEALVGCDTDINLQGCAKVTVLKGCVLAHGCMLSSKSPGQIFYASTRDPALAIKIQQTGEEDLTHAFGSYFSSTTTADVENLSKCQAVIHLSCVDDSEYHVYPKYPNLFCMPSENEISRELCTGCYLVGSKSVLIDFPGYGITCDEILQEMEGRYGEEKQCDDARNRFVWNNASVVTVGNKGTGKSTFNRYLVNYLLNHYDMVNYVDCDVGQPEFTISGCVSVSYVTSPILGPPFTHLAQPRYCSYFGALTASQDPDRYVDCVNDAMLHIKPGYPVVVNTMGWIKDLGMNLLVDVLKLTQPAFVVQISLRKEFRPSPHITRGYVDDFDSVTKLTAADIPDYRHFWIKIDLPNQPTLHRGDMRDLRLLSYFRRVQEECTVRDFGEGNRIVSIETLCSVKPYMVFLKDVLICVCHDSSILKCHALSVLNCAIVGLSTVSKSDFDQGSTNKYLGPPPTSKCHGFGIVRGVCPSNQALFIITSLPRETLVKVNCVSLGSVLIPNALYEDEKMKSVIQSKAPYVVKDFPTHVRGSNRFRSYKIFK